MCDHYSSLNPSIITSIKLFNTIKANVVPVPEPDNRRSCQMNTEWYKIYIFAEVRTTSQLSIHPMLLLFIPETENNFV